MILATGNSALIIPAVPGRPFWRELASLIGASGIIVTMALRRQADGVGSRLKGNLLMYGAMAGYCVVLLFLMYYRGIGIRVLGGDGVGQMGGRLYLQQLACSILPVLLLIKPPEEKTLVRLFMIQCFLSVTFMLSDLIFASGRSALFTLLLFLELPTDGENFEFQSMSFGIRRFQSFFTVALSMLSVLWVKRPLDDYGNKNAFWIWPLTFGVMAFGMLSGHRHLLYISGVMLLAAAWGQRFFNPMRLVMLFVAAASMYLMIFAFSRDLPLSAQRAISFVPGIEVDRMAYDDAKATMDGRRTLRDSGFEVAKEYLWVGRGFGKNAQMNREFYKFDMSYMNIDNGIFYNGTIGLLVNTGLIGTLLMFTVLGSGSLLAWRILGQVRVLGANDDFTRLSCVLASYWFAVATSFVFLHGDAEYAMRSFGMPAGLLMVCNWRLSNRIQSRSAEMEGQQESQPDLLSLPTPSPVG
jgi:hypothetical protein